MASIIKADNIQKVSDGSNIIKKCGSTITLGSCGATISLAAGATQTGFGQTYSAVEYCTTAKTSPFTAVAGTGYFINTTCGAVTVTLPASPTAGDVISFKDYAGQWNTNNLTLCNNGNKINGSCGTAQLSTQNQSVTLIYVDSTKGWQDIQDSTSGVSGESYITATGGTITTCGDYKIHTFTADGCFSVSAGNGPLAVADYLVVAGGGGGGGGDRGGGGGAGGFRESKNPAAPWTASPLASATSLSVSISTYPITVGGGGAAPSAGSPSSFSTITSTGGGKGGSCGSQPTSGGSGGGGSGYCGAVSGASGNTPPTSPPQGNNGGNGIPSGSGNSAGGGGGGANVAGSPATPPGTGGPGGNGATTSISGSPTAYAGGGGGFSVRVGEPAVAGGTGGTGGGGNGGPWCGSPGPSPAKIGTPGSANTGGGGGGAGSWSVGGGTGGSGIVIIRYRYQ